MSMDELPELVLSDSGRRALEHIKQMAHLDAMAQEELAERLELQALAGLRAALMLVDPNYGREGLENTPHRWLKALREATSGAKQAPLAMLGTTFENDGYDEMVVKRAIAFTSTCEHHLLPFVGTVDIGYIPSVRVVGLSKLSRLVDCISRRLQIQERMTVQIADAILQALNPLGVGVVVRAEHSCVACRGVRKAGAEMVTSALRGAMKEDRAAREEFLRLAGR